MRHSLLLLSFAALGLAGCVSVTPAPRPATTTVVMPPSTTYVAPATSYRVPTDTTTTTTKRWSD